ncbi:YcnI family protein [Blastococcus sp. BMG 814]|uniref:YcnI family protein n=1 Tax=Blastococcus carthaginiensis TaxID=3050034 RepID=A0ABT9I9U3_9ACTN|nr:YcnI family protein [Blastococcus carthaginiensis]MDP5182345.1 YcnI family protein [Blastococcus carthaginiensis]
MSSTRLLPRAAAVLLAVLTAFCGAVVFATSAAAHVTVSSDDAAPGGYGKLTFRVPNESDTASTTALRIQIPEEAAMGSLRVQPVPGWTITTETTELAEPIEVRGRELSSYISVVEYRAAGGGGIAPGEFQEFALSGGPFPDAEQLSFPAVQSYSDGSEAAWIEPAVAGQDEPERPAPVLSLAAGAAQDGHGTADAEVAAADDGTAGHSADPGSVALFLSILALLVAVAGVVLGIRASRRTVSS